MPIVSPREKKEYIADRRNRLNKRKGAVVPYAKQRDEVLSLLESGYNEFYLLIEVYKLPQSFTATKATVKTDGFKADNGYIIRADRIEEAIDIAEATASQHKTEFIVYFLVFTPDMGRRNEFRVRTRTEEVERQTKDELFEAEAFDDSYIQKERHDA